jgi:hypothetical protein
MGPYGFCLALGVTGLVVMAVLGFGHHGADHSHHLGDGHFHGHGDGHAHAHGPGHGHEPSALGRLTALLSPRLLFSVLVGIGATGVLLSPILPGPGTLLAALGGGYVFERWLVGPIWKLLFRFESRPAATLESAIMEEAEAMTDFGAAGEGMIGLELDGQVVQLLGTLTAADRAAGRRVRQGDRLRIEEVDEAGNRCTVSFIRRELPETAP